VTPSEAAGGGRQLTVVAPLGIDDLVNCAAADIVRPQRGVDDYEDRILEEEMARV